MNSDSNEAPDLMNYWHTADYSSTVDAYNGEIERKDREREGVNQGQRTHTSPENWSDGQPGSENSWNLTTTINKWWI